jgi:hypothetical protein
LSDSTTLEKKYDKQNLSIMYCSKFLGAFCWGRISKISAKTTY